MQDFKGLDFLNLKFKNRYRRESTAEHTEIYLQRFLDVLQLNRSFQYL